MLPLETEHALAIGTYVREEHGRWVVYAEVTFIDVVRRFRLRDYRSKRRAEIAARCIRRGADQPPPRR
jgi:hypothetical protein